MIACQPADQAGIGRRLAEDKKARRASFAKVPGIVVSITVLTGTTKKLRGALAFGDAAQAASVKLPRACPGRGFADWRLDLILGSGRRCSTQKSLFPAIVSLCDGGRLGHRAADLLQQPVPEGRHAR